MQTTASAKTTTPETVFAHSTKWMANIGGGVLAFFLTPVLYNATDGMIANFTRSNYGYDLAGMAVFLWGILLAVGLFFASRLLIATGTTALGVLYSQKIVSAKKPKGNYYG
ncbi:MAG: hypothetical protein CMK09_00085 [Ponticaulis sp.]|nr:hypothetical protein [Ponticaulis sp.]|tara:strand:- start:36633 stop:36965 length:333 start_codon:yes stop_codon:yes gene_type:complete